MWARKRMNACNMNIYNMNECTYKMELDANVCVCLCVCEREEENKYTIERLCL